MISDQKRSSCQVFQPPSAQLRQRIIAARIGMHAVDVHERGRVKDARGVDIHDGGVVFDCQQLNRGIVRGGLFGQARPFVGRGGIEQAARRCAPRRRITDLATKSLAPVSPSFCRVSSRLAMKRSRLARSSSTVGIAEFVQVKQIVGADPNRRGRRAAGATQGVYRPIDLVRLAVRAAQEIGGGPPCAREVDDLRAGPLGRKDRSDAARPPAAVAGVIFVAFGEAVA